MFVPNHRWDIDSLTAELGAVLDSEGLAKAHLFGWSKGTLVGQCFLAKFPERVLSLGGYGWLNPAFPGTATFFSRIQERLSGFNLIADLWEKPLTPGRFWRLWQVVYRRAFLTKSVSPMVEAALVFKLYRLAKPTTIGNMVRWFSYLLANHESLGKMVEIAFNQSVPILIQHAKRDDTLPIAMARDARDRYRNATLIEYDPPFGHVSVGFLKEQATNVVADYAEFLALISKGNQSNPEPNRVKDPDFQQDF